MGNNFIDQLILPSDVSSTQTQPQSSQITINSAGMPRGIKRRQATEYRHNPFSRPMEVKHQAPPNGTHLHKKVIWNQFGPVLTWLSRCNRVWLHHSLINNTSPMFFFNHKCSISRLGIISRTLKWMIIPACNIKSNWIQSYYQITGIMNSLMAISYSILVILVIGWR